MAGDDEVDEVDVQLVVHAGHVIGDGLQASFLADLPDGGLGDRFARLRPAARQLPVEAAVAVLDEQDPALLVQNDRRGADATCRQFTTSPV
jgi:hypothetical protein